MTRNSRGIKERFSCYSFIYMSNSSLFHQWFSSSTPHDSQSLYSFWQRAIFRNVDFVICSRWKIDPYEVVWYEILVIDFPTDATPQFLKKVTFVLLKLVVGNEDNQKRNVFLAFVILFTCIGWRAFSFPNGRAKQEETKVVRIIRAAKFHEMHATSCLAERHACPIHPNWVGSSGIRNGPTHRMSERAREKTQHGVYRVYKNTIGHGQTRPYLFVPVRLTGSPIARNKKYTTVISEGIKCPSHTDGHDRSPRLLKQAHKTYVCLGFKTWVYHDQRHKTHRCTWGTQSQLRWP